MAHTTFTVAAPSPAGALSPRRAPGAALSLKRLAALSALAALTACGGGGGGGSSGGNTPVPVGPTPVPAPGPAPAPAPTQPPAFFLPSTLRTQAATPTYGANSLEKLGFDLFNSELGRCGLGFANQDVRLDRAAKAHGDWMALNNQFSHTADGTRFPNGFTGTTPTDRARFQGYPNGTGEDLALIGMQYGDSASERAAALSAMRNLLAAPFHLYSMASSSRDVGIAYTKGGDLGLTQGRQNELYLTLVPASVATQERQDISSDEVATYPCEGSTGVHGAVYGEDPNPVPGRNLATNPIGNAILVRTNLLSKIAVTSFALTETSTGAQVQVLAPVVLNNAHMYFANAPLKKSTRYTVTTRGTANGVAFTKTFTYTTGANF